MTSRSPPPYSEEDIERLVLSTLRFYQRAVIGQCEAYDLVPTEDDALHVRCTNMGVRIREYNGVSDRTRHRTVCPTHGYDPTTTPPLDVEQT